MLKKIVFTSILSILILGVSLLIPNILRDFPIPSLIQPLNISKTVPETTIILTGDIMLGRSVMAESLSKNDPVYPFAKVADTLFNANIVFANLEAPITENCPITSSGMIFCAQPEMISGLNSAGIDIVNIANNHIKNYGETGYEQTKNFLTDNRIDYVGDGNLVIKEENEVKFGFLGFNFVDTIPKQSDLDLIRNSKEKVDVLITMVHWGNEYTQDPTSIQKEIAVNLINSGVDVIAGTHPHWVQGYDYLNEKYIFYSLGNFIFDQAWSEETKQGMAVRLTYQKGKLIKVTEMPIYMERFAQPEFIK